MDQETIDQETIDQKTMDQETEETANPCAIPTRLEDDDWLSQHTSHIHKAKNQKPDVILIGASIIQLIRCYPIWFRLFDPLNSFNFGISGDRTENVLWRVQHDILENINPRVCILNVGSNNIDSLDCKCTDVADGILTIVDTIRSKLPNCYIIIIGLLPSGEYPNGIRLLAENINDIVSEKVENMDHIEFFRPNLLQPDGQLNKDDAFDFLHPTERGYYKIFKPIFERLKKILSS